MKIRYITGIYPDVLLRKLADAFRNSRFKVIGWQLRSFEQDSYIFLPEGSVRLHKRKLFCGNHPAACERIGEHPERRSVFLEGADWVEFNDTINDVLDAEEVSAIVYSNPRELKHPLYIRRGFHRRINYSYEHVQFREFGPGANVWNGYDSSDFEVRVGKTSGPSEIPFGTPGIHERAGYAVVG